MANKLCIGLLYLLSWTGFVCSWENCSCLENGAVLDCSYRSKSVFMASDLKPCENARTLNLRGNYLQTFQFYRIFAGLLKLDLADNELGLGHPSLLLQNAALAYQLDISSNYIKYLNFSTCIISQLNASYNMISDLKGLNICQNLQYLRINDNNISHLPNNTFDQIRTIRYIDLSHNPISIVEEEAFRNRYDLETLLLSDTRVLTSLPERVFSRLVRLKTLSLANNRLTHLPRNIFEDLLRLEVLQLESNELENLPEGIFRRLNNVRSLILSNNKIDKLSADQFSKLHSLENLSLRNNRLKSLPSLHLCSGPLRTALFDNNSIMNLKESDIRGLMRYGFMFGDLRQNPLPKEDIKWAENASDITIDWHDRPCGLFNLRVPNHGTLFICYNST